MKSCVIYVSPEVSTVFMDGRPELAPQTDKDRAEAVGCGQFSPSNPIGTVPIMNVRGEKIDVPSSLQGRGFVDTVLAPNLTVITISQLAAARQKKAQQQNRSEAGSPSHENLSHTPSREMSVATCHTITAHNNTKMSVLLFCLLGRMKAGWKQKPQQ